MENKKTPEEIAKLVYPISRKENHITSVKLHNKRVLKIDAFVKGYNYALSQPKSDLDELRKEFDKQFQFHFIQPFWLEEIYFWFTSRLPNLQKPESDAVEFALHLIKADLDRPNRVEDELNQLNAEYIKFKQSK